LNRSESVVNLVKALAAAQGVMEPARKGSKNPHFGSDYADLADVCLAARGPLAQNGLAVTHTPFVAGDWFMLESTLWHASGEFIAAELPVVNLARAEFNPQRAGAALTYQKRYALQALINLASEGEDDDGETAAGRGRHDQAPSQARCPEPARRQARAGPRAGRDVANGNPPAPERGEAVTAMVSRKLKEANDAWQNDQAIAAVPTERRTELSNTSRAFNALITCAIGDSVVLAEKVAQEGHPDKRDRELCKDAVRWLWRTDPEYVIRTLDTYLGGRLDEEREKLRGEAYEEAASN
jgi:hypothetical protein